MNPAGRQIAVLGQAPASNARVQILVLRHLRLRKDFTTSRRGRCGHQATLAALTMVP